MPPQYQYPSSNNLTPQQLANQSIQLLTQLETAIMSAITTNNKYMTQVANGGQGNATMALKVNGQLMTIFEQIQADIMSNQNGGQPAASSAPKPT